MTTAVALLATDGTLMFWCPGCKEHHGVPVDGSRGWEWDGDKVRPTIKPSILVRSGRDMKNVCHSFVRGGHIEFLSDCTHDLAGKTVPLEPINPATTPREAGS